VVHNGAAVASLPHLREGGAAGFIGNLKQMAAFLTVPDVKEETLQRVADEVTRDTRVIIGHSLGSVVVYEYLARYDPPQVDLLVTLGSPRGIPNLIFERLTPARADGAGAWPGGVSGWVNVADADEVVALRKRLAPIFPALWEGLELTTTSPLADRARGLAEAVY
jgi:pimeloyl-ACP methyl ester carboxylesterase